MTNAEITNLLLRVRPTAQVLSEMPGAIRITLDAGAIKREHSTARAHAQQRLEQEFSTVGLHFTLSRIQPDRITAWISKSHFAYFDPFNL